MTPGYTLRAFGWSSTQASSTRTGGLMPETLTESFCERCGSRYTFESAAPKQRMRGMRVLSRGVKNFVLDDKTSFDEAMASARMDTDRESTNAQLDAFHKTFNFCMECRQYTCPNCWNEVEGRCLGCAPMLTDVGPAVAASPFHTGIATPLSAPTNGAAATNGMAARNGTGATYGAAATNGHALVEPDAEFDPLARLAFLTAAAPAAEPEPVVEASPEPEPVAEIAVEPMAEPAVEPLVEAAVGPEIAADEPVAAEPVVAAAEVAAEAEPDADALAAAAIAAALIEPEWIPTPEQAEPVVEAVAEPELVAEPVVEAVAEPELVAEPVVEAVAEPELVAEPVVEAVAEPELVAEPVVEAVAEPELVAEPVVEAVAEPELA